MKIIEVKEFKRYGSLELMQFGLIIQAVSHLSEQGKDYFTVKFTSCLQAQRVANLLIGVGFRVNVNYFEKERTTELVVNWGFLE